MQLVPGETVRTVRLQKLAAIEGRVIDRDGRPIAGIPVRLMARGMGPLGIGFVGTPSATDERGGFSFSSLVGASTYSFILTHAQLADATVAVTLSPGESRTGIELRAERLPVFRVAGRITDGAGAGVDAMAYLDRADSPTNPDLLRRLAPLATKITIEYDVPVTHDLRRATVPRNPQD